MHDKEVQEVIKAEFNHRFWKYAAFYEFVYRSIWCHRFSTWLIWTIYPKVLPQKLIWCQQRGLQLLPKWGEVDFFGQNPSSAHRIDFSLQHVIPLLRAMHVKGSFVISWNIFSAFGVKFCKQIAPTFLQHLRLYRIHNCIEQCTFGWHMWCHCQCRPLTQLLLSSFSAFLQNCVALVEVVTN